MKGLRLRLRWNLRSVQARRRGVEVELDADVKGGVEVEADVGSDIRPGEGASRLSLGSSSRDVAYAPFPAILPTYCSRPQNAAP